MAREEDNGGREARGGEILTPRLKRHDDAGLLGVERPSFSFKNKNKKKVGTEMHLAR